ncbi:MAG: hypothetical protein EXR77_10480 [Myxococcales bacterium]|nr:hypothetical protein [Myxococcales bacterium]
MNLFGRAVQLDPFAQSKLTDCTRVRPRVTAQLAPIPVHVGNVGQRGLSIRFASVVVTVTALLASACSQNNPPSTPAQTATSDPYADLPKRSNDTGLLDEPLDLALELTQADANTTLPGSVFAAVRAKGPWSGKLALVLTELGQPASQYKELVREFARAGHHAVAIPLGLPKALTQVCGGVAVCFEQARWELHNGSDRTPLLTVKYADSVENRLTLVALALAKNGQGWGQFVVSGKPNWATVLAAGHGEGAGQAAFMGTQLVIARVVLLQGPADSVGDSPAPWLTSSHQTANAKWFAFGHTGASGWAAIAKVWTAIGLGGGAGAWPSVDQGAVMGVQAYTTHLSVSEPHLAVATDATTPLDANGKPKYRTTWRSLIGP